MWLCGALEQRALGQRGTGSRDYWVSDGNFFFSGRAVVVTQLCAEHV